ncbi:MAG: gcp [Chlamydiales bacterium]|jgi:N6-L-threonylcarbamoyladenine synthase|nr:gcp [Chlamydiales bacterium]
MLTLGIESTCDETAAAVVKDGRQILSNIISSQIERHRPFGGVVPELASRCHIERIIPVIEEALKQAGCSLEEIDLIAVASGPGLIGALLVGLNTAKALSLALNKPLIGVNHIESHLYAALMSHPPQDLFPAIGVILSGGHTSLIHMQEVGDYQLIGQTVDDAAGEAFDKAAKLLHLPYPGGPEIEKLAQSGNPAAFPFKAGTVKGKPFDFSFSGLKTSLLYTIRQLEKEGPLQEGTKKDLAASFQRAALGDIVRKVEAAAALYQPKSILFGGGVTNNRALKSLFKIEIPLLWPEKDLSLDNAAMIAGLGAVYYQKGALSPLTLAPETRIAF